MYRALIFYLRVLLRVRLSSRVRSGAATRDPDEFRGIAVGVRVWVIASLRAPNIARYIYECTDRYINMCARAARAETAV